MRTNNFSWLACKQWVKTVNKNGYKINSSSYQCCVDCHWYMHLKTNTRQINEVFFIVCCGVAKICLKSYAITVSSGSASPSKPYSFCDYLDEQKNKIPSVPGITYPKKCKHGKTFCYTCYQVGLEINIPCVCTAEKSCIFHKTKAKLIAKDMVADVQS